MTGELGRAGIHSLARKVAAPYSYSALVVGYEESQFRRGEMNLTAQAVNNISSRLRGFRIPILMNFDTIIFDVQQSYERQKETSGMYPSLKRAGISLDVKREVFLGYLLDAIFPQFHAALISAEPLEKETPCGKSRFRSNYSEYICDLFHMNNTLGYSLNGNGSLNLTQISGQSEFLEFAARDMRVYRWR